MGDNIAISSFGTLPYNAVCVVSLISLYHALDPEHRVEWGSSVLVVWVPLNSYDTEEPYMNRSVNKIFQCLCENIWKPHASHDPVALNLPITIYTMGKSVF